MARCVGFLSLLLLVGVPWAQAADLSGESRFFEQSVELAPGGRLQMKTFKGSVRLEAWDRDLVEVTARIEAPDEVSEDHARRTVKATRVEMRGSGQSVRIRSDYDDVPPVETGWFGGETRILPYVHYTIRAPRQLDFEIDDHKSSIELTGFEGRIEIKTHKGRVQLADLAGRLDLATHKGHVRIEGLVGRLDLATHKGDVEVEGFELEGSSELKTHKGRIRVVLAAGQGLDIRADIGEKGDFSSNGLELEREEDGDDRLYRGRLNGGGPSLSFQTYKGEIELEAR